MTTRTRIPTAALVALLVVGCGDKATEPEAETFGADLSAANIVAAAVVSDGTGSATFSWDGELLDYDLAVADMEGIINAHIHGPGTTEENAPIVLTLYSPSEPTGPFTGPLVSGLVGEGSPELSAGVTLAHVLDLMRMDSAYVLVHTSEYPNGEIRGQVVPD